MLQPELPHLTLSWHREREEPPAEGILRGLEFQDR